MDFLLNERNKCDVKAIPPLAMGAPIVAEGNERIAKGGRSDPDRFLSG